MHNVQEELIINDKYRAVHNNNVIVTVRYKLES